MTGYTDRLKAAVALGVIPPGEVTHVTVEHAPTCRHNPCTCFPLVTAKVRGEVLTLGTGGTVLDRRKVQ